MHIDLNAPDITLNPGIDAWEIVSCDSKRSRAGDSMLALKLARIADRFDTMYDNIMLEGGGWGIGKAKLAALLGPGFAGELDTSLLRGLRLWVATKVDTWDGKDRLAVDIKQLEHAGYQPLTDVPEGCTPPEPPVEAPF